MSHLKPFEVPLVNSRKVDLRLNSSKIRKLQILEKLFHHVLKHLNLTQKNRPAFFEKLFKEIQFCGKIHIFRIFEELSQRSTNAWVENFEASVGGTEPV